ncbi:hypothetical protein JCM19231_3259 [Vibrio ishigakensis]|uniref:Uncharacterized protein n=1 Tax=Vibrio ishigakensis TaxID=1481914 RepID=A0A0B8P1D6_9VIBR|nr:hypothetical protein JCM19231_3259 [Vibrio ishigakensis]
MLELGAKELIQSLDKLMYDFDLEKISGFIDHNFAPNAKIQLAHPFETLSNPQALAYEVYQPLLEAVPDLEKRTYISMAGEARGAYWVGVAGYYTGSFLEPCWIFRQPVIRCRCAFTSSIALKTIKWLKYKPCGIFRSL